MIPKIQEIVARTLDPGEEYNIVENFGDGSSLDVVANSLPNFLRNKIIIAISSDPNHVTKSCKNIANIKGTINTPEDEMDIITAITKARDYINNVDSATYENFLLMNFKSLTTTVESYKKDLAAKQREIDIHKKKEEVLMKEYAALSEKLYNSENVNFPGIEALIKKNDFNKLLDMYSSIKFVSMHRLLVTTKELVLKCHRSDTFYRLVPVEIQIDMLDNSYGMSCKNPTTGGKATHPHINSGGGVCPGNMQDIFVRCFAKQTGGQFIVDGLTALWELLNNHNPASVYNNLVTSVYHVSEVNNDANQFFNDCLKQAIPRVHCVLSCNSKTCPHSETKFKRCFDDISSGGDDNKFICKGCGLCEAGKKWAES